MHKVNVWLSLRHNATRWSMRIYYFQIKKSFWGLYTITVKSKSESGQDKSVALQCIYTIATTDKWVCPMETLINFAASKASPRQYFCVGLRRAQWQRRRMRIISLSEHRTSQSAAWMDAPAPAPWCCLYYTYLDGGTAQRISMWH